MKKTILLLLVLFLLAACFMGCNKANNASPGNVASNTAAPARTFTVGFDAEFPPFGFVAEDGSYDGFDLAVAQEVCKRLGWTFKAQPINWDAKDSELASGNIDCIWNGFTYEGRENDYAWTPAYYNNSVIIVVKADSDIKTLADLKGKKVITQAGSSALSALEEDTALSSTFDELLESADFNNCFLELGMGSVDAVASDYGVAMYNIGDKASDYRILEEEVASETYAIGFLKGNDALAKEVWAAVEAIAKDGTMAKLADKYIEYGLVKESITLIG